MAVLNPAGPDKTSGQAQAVAGGKEAAGASPTVTSSLAEDVVTNGSTTEQLIPDMTITPAAGTYVVIFDGKSDDNSTSRWAQIRMWKNGVTGSLLVGTTRKWEPFVDPSYSSRTCACVVSVNGTDTVGVFRDVQTGSQSLGWTDRRLIAFRVAP